MAYEVRSKAAQGCLVIWLDGYEVLRKYHFGYDFVCEREVPDWRVYAPGPLARLFGATFKGRVERAVARLSRLRARLEAADLDAEQAREAAGLTGGSEGLG